MAKKIGIDARFYGEAGPGRYVKNIIKGLEQQDLENTYYVFLRDYGIGSYFPENKNFHKVRAEYKWYTFAEQIAFLIMLMRFKLDLFYVPHFNIPILYPGKIITAIPDLIMHTYSTERGTTLPKFYFKFKKWVYALVVNWAVIKSKCIIVPSQVVKNDFLKIYPKIPQEKYIVAYEGIDREIFLESKSGTEPVLNKYGIRKPYLLYISSMYEHKNVLKLIKAFKMINDRDMGNPQLVLVGKKDNYSDAIELEVKSMGYEHLIRMPGQSGFVNDKETSILRKNALLYVFPSLKEGFSLTPLEAQAFDLPCVISDIDIHREVYGDSVYYFNPESMEDIAEKIHDLITDQNLQTKYRELGKRNIKKFSWNSTTEVTLACFTKYS